MISMYGTEDFKVQSGIAKRYDQEGKLGLYLQKTYGIDKTINWSKIKTYKDAVRNPIVMGAIANNYAAQHIIESLREY